jgi:hypothetical protein
MTDKVITAEMFFAATGEHPRNDDLERCNCKKAGQILHFHCGWNSEKNLPVFMCELNKYRDRQ